MAPAVVHDMAVANNEAPVAMGAMENNVARPTRLQWPWTMWSGALQADVADVAPVAVGNMAKGDEAVANDVAPVAVGAVINDVTSGSRGRHGYSGRR